MADARHGETAGIWQILKETAACWSRDNVPKHGAALAYYTIFAITPLLLLAIAVASFFVGEEAARGELETHLRGYLGENGAKAIQALLESAKDNEKAGSLAVWIGVISLVFGASAMFHQLKDSLNTIWGVEEKRKGVVGFLINRGISILMVAMIGLLLLASVVASAAISTVVKFIGPLLQVSPKVLHLVELGTSFVMLTVLFGLLFRVLPDVKLRWQNVWLGAVFTSVLFSIGKFAIGLYIARGGLANSYGAAGSLVVLLVWIYYSSMIFFFGAEFTRVFSRLRGLRVEVAESGEIAPEPPAREIDVQAS